MQTGDGLLARIRVQHRTLSPIQLVELARLAIVHGNGILEVSARGNLQARGLNDESAPRFAKCVSNLVSLEPGLVIDVSPLAGDDPTEIADPLPLAARIRLGAQSLEEKLGPKVSVIIDGGGQVALSQLNADIRLIAQDETHWAVHLGGGKPQIMDTDGAIAATLAVLGALAAIGPEARASDLFASSAGAAPISIRSRRGAGIALKLLGGSTHAIALPFGQMQSEAIIALGEAAVANGVTQLRLAPDHTLLLDNAPAALISIAEKLGYITDLSDPRQRTSACIGNEGCASGHIASRRIATDLVHLIPAGQHLHVSGCAKGCAHPRPSAITLVGRADGIGLVIDGRAGDTPQQILDEAGLAPALAVWQDTR